MGQLLGELIKNDYKCYRVCYVLQDTSKMAPVTSLNYAATVAEKYGYPNIGAE